ncbi:hypothetical protein J7E73_29800 [Paenibacillus albidus]|uniref:hypothetical protein n=1 Tax=Paenibacillus albidus TaxID=2041023 RepID=UPI001BE73672|nr:hypothetical protein [Paenibacillus albidus]MBT2293228.1 hypothetical protein [Paenibacillus albidus]
MGWSELREIPNNYNGETQRIDEQILGLVKQRRAMAGGKRFVPGAELLEEWAAKFGMETDQLMFILHSLNDQERNYHLREPGELLAVLPLMKKTISGDCEYMLTHVMQHKEASLVTLEIKYLLEEDAGEVYLKPNLTLEVLGGEEYNIRRHGSHGGGLHTQMQFMIIPPLPDDLGGLEFSLVPSAIFLERKLKEVKLDQQVDFY